VCEGKFEKHASIRPGSGEPGQPRQGVGRKDQNSRRLNVGGLAAITGKKKEMSVLPVSASAEKHWSPPSPVLLPEDREVQERKTV